MTDTVQIDGQTLPLRWDDDHLPHLTPEAQAMIKQRFGREAQDVMEDVYPGVVLLFGDKDLHAHYCN